MIRAVLFDVGGLLNTEEAFEAAIDADIRAGLEREGYAVDDSAGILRAIEALLAKDGA